MSQLLIELPDENEAILLSLLPKLDGRLIEKKAAIKKPSLAEVLEKIIQSGEQENRLGIHPSGSVRYVVGIGYLMDVRNDFSCMNQSFSK